MRRGEAACRILAVDARREGEAAPEAVPLPLDIFRISPLHLRHGPAAARGVVVFGHGYGGSLRDARQAPLPGWLSVFNDAGWDILRHDRDPAEDSLYNTLPRLIRALPRLRAAGYRHVVLAGSSRGAWQALLAAGEAEGVDAVIALAPANHGDGRSGIGHLAALDDWRRVLASLPAGRVPVAAAFFNTDPFDVDPDRRAAMLVANGASRGVPVLALRPAAPVLGHGGGSHWRFSHDHAACLLRFAEAAAAGASAAARAACSGVR
jgi:dienelactone hydrolase